MTRRNVSRALRRAFLLGVSAASLACAAAVHADPVASGADDRTATVTPIDRGAGVTEARYFLMSTVQTFDGVRERSHAQKAGFARLHRADESWIRIDFGDGAMVINEPGSHGQRGHQSAGEFVSVTPTELAMSYDYRSNTLRGNSAGADYHNTYIRPLLNHAPELGADAAWRMAVTPAQIGVAKVSGGAFAMSLKRHYFSRGGRDYVILEWEVPAFTYVDAKGEMVTHWARGAALADPTLGEIYWNASLQHAAARQASGAARPYRYARTGYAMDAKGKPLVDLDAIPEMRPYLAEFYAASATAPIPTVEGESDPDQSPLELAMRIDTVAFAVAENSPNQLAETLLGLFGGQGQTVGKGLDYLINYGLIPIPAGMSGAANQEAELEKSIQTVWQDLSRIEQENASLRRRIKAGRDSLAALNAEYAALGNTYRAEATASRVGVEMADLTKGTLARAMAVREQALAQAAKLKDLGMRLGANVYEINVIQNSLPKLRSLQELMRTSGAYRVASGLGQLIAKNQMLARTFTGLGYAVNLEGIRKNIIRLRNFDPYKAGDVDLNGTYEGFWGFAEPLANLLALGGDVAQGDMKGVFLDTANFGGGRLADLYMTFQAMDAAMNQRDWAMEDELRTRLLKIRKDAERERVAASKMDQAIIDSIDRAVAQIEADLANRQSPTFHSDKTGPDGRITIDYWLWLHDHDPQALRAYGIDPNGPIGVYPKTPGTRTASNTPPPPDDPDQPRQPGGPGYPTHAPMPHASHDPNVPDDDDPPLPTPVDLPEPFHPTPHNTDLSTHMDDPVITPYGTARLDVSPLNWDPVTFDAPRWTPVTWDPPVWEPVTWDPPTWTPPHFDAPTPSEIPWTDFGDGQWGSDINDLAFDYGDMEGKVATDLSPWAEWLKTQDVRELERLAISAGYPNLASALTDARNLIKHANDTGYREWAYSMPAFSGSIGEWASAGQHDLARAQVLLGDLLGQSRDIFSSGGFSDLGISGFDLSYLLLDYGLEDGDIVDIKLSQFGRPIYTGRLSLLNLGTAYQFRLQPGIAKLEITAVNEGFAPPNTAQINVDHVVSGEATQTYSLNTGDTATLRIEANAPAGH